MAALVKRRHFQSRHTPCLSSLLCCPSHSKHNFPLLCTPGLHTSKSSTAVTYPTECRPPARIVLRNRKPRYPTNPKTLRAAMPGDFVLENHSARTIVTFSRPCGEACPVIGTLPAGVLKTYMYFVLCIYGGHILSGSIFSLFGRAIKFSHLETIARISSHQQPAPCLCPVRSPPTLD